MTGLPMTAAEAIVVPPPPVPIDGRTITYHTLSNMHCASRQEAREGMMLGTLDGSPAEVDAQLTDGMAAFQALRVATDAVVKVRDDYREALYKIASVHMTSLAAAKVIAREALGE